MPEAASEANHAAPAAEDGPRIGGPASWALRQVLLANRDAEQALARRLGLGSNDVTAMEHLLSAPEGLGPMDIAHRLGIRSASATVLVDRLEQAGHVTRGPHRTDRRRTVVRPTAHAREEIVAALLPLVAAVDEAAAELTEDEQATVVRFLHEAAHRIAAEAQRMNPPTDS